MKNLLMFQSSFSKFNKIWPIRWVSDFSNVFYKNVNFFSWKTLLEKIYSFSESVQNYLTKKKEFKVVSTNNLQRVLNKKKIIILFSLLITILVIWINNINLISIDRNSNINNIIVNIINYDVIYIFTIILYLIFFIILYKENFVSFYSLVKDKNFSEIKIFCLEKFLLLIGFLILIPLVWIATADSEGIDSENFEFNNKKDSIIYKNIDENNMLEKNQIIHMGYDPVTSLYNLLVNFNYTNVYNYSAKPFIWTYNYFGSIFKTSIQVQNFDNEVNLNLQKELKIKDDLIQAKDNEIIDLKNQNEIFLSSACTLNKVLQSVVDQKAKVLSENSSLQKANEYLKRENAGILQETVTLDQWNTGLTDENFFLKKKNNQYKNDYEISKKEIGYLKKKNNQYKNDYEVSEKEIDYLKKEKKELTKQKKELKKNLEYFVILPEAPTKRAETLANIDTNYEGCDENEKLLIVKNYDSKRQLQKSGSVYQSEIFHTFQESAIISNQIIGGPNGSIEAKRNYDDLNSNLMHVEVDNILNHGIAGLHDGTFASKNSSKTPYNSDLDNESQALYNREHLNFKSLENKKYINHLINEQKVIQQQKNIQTNDKPK